MYLLCSDHATGLIRLLTIGLRVLTLLEFVGQSNLSSDSLAACLRNRPLNKYGTKKKRKINLV